ncbi:MAG TPA: adenylate/guanylate cyclase domain-containing protein, partial [Caulobacteraceae bacterium]
MSDGAVSKKLASIVAIDVAGYSRSTETDEDAAIKAVAALRERITQAAKAHGGRVFNTAGDGFMLEFASVAGALAAAEEIASGPGPPRRVGVHLGDVTVTPEGDLLDHGVNVAARIQQMASPGAVLASGDVKRAIRGPLGERLKPQGSVRLNKMSEVVPVFALANPDGGRTRGRRRKLVAPLAVALGALFLAALGLLELRGAFHPFEGPARQASGGARKAVRVSAPRFDVLDTTDADLKKFAGGLQAEMVDQLNQNQINVAAPDQGSSAGGGPAADYAFGGAVERDGSNIVARVQLNDTRQHVTVWSGAYSRAAANAGVLQDEIASEAAEVASVAVRSDSLANGDPDVTSLEIKSDLFADRNRDEDRESEWENDKRLLAKLPRLSYSHSNFAVVSIFLAAISTPQRAAELRALAAREATTALQLNPHDPLAVFARVLLFPMVGHWLERENELLIGLKADPENALLTTHESNFLREVGRLEDAVSFGRQAAAPEPRTPNRDSTLLLALAETGRFGEASSLADTAARAWPTHPALWSARLQALI